MVPFVSIVGGMVVVVEMVERASLVASEKPDQPYSNLAGRVGNLRAVNKFKAGHDGHGLSGGGQGGGCDSGGGRITCFAKCRWFLPWRLLGDEIFFRYSNSLIV